MQRVWAVILSLSVFSTQMAFGEAFVKSNDYSFYRLTRNADDPRNGADVFLSLILPGWGQWREDQHPWAELYSGTALAGLGYAAINLTKKDGATFRGSDRNVAIGLQVYQEAGEISAYHAFQTMARSPHQSGRYSFLTVEDTPMDVLTAPFRLDYLLRPTSIVPLALVGVIFFALLPRLDESVDFSRMTTGDWAFTGATSYMAGTGEEAIFRGAMMPYFRGMGMNGLASNLTTATVFAAAHVNFKNPFVPWPQFVLGFYEGWVTQYRGWSISEAIFIHTWYDVIVFAASYATDKKNATYLPFPKIDFRF